MTTRQTEPADLLASPVRRRLVDALSEVGPGPRGGPRTAAELADVVGLHVTTVRFHLDRLVAAGLVTTDFRRQGAGRPRKVYGVVAQAVEDVSGRTEVASLRLLSGLLARTLEPGRAGHATPAEVGRQWALDHVPVEADARPAESPGRWLSKLGRVVDVLRTWGYSPEVATSDGGRTADITLSGCPFLDLARDNEAVVCGIHRGLIAGSLERLGEAGAHVSLEPFVGPTTCRAHVTTTTPFLPATSKESA
ncbi:helix-turn-helix transcriptional regulator [Oryzobacter terrae]|uniref:helix-turn-helix transcriptional regulator n=1 Tax=Oryzobacter terrae TaxID=1620385 RepID=UPI00366E1D63